MPGILLYVCIAYAILITPSLLTTFLFLVGKEACCSLLFTTDFLHFVIHPVEILIAGKKSFKKYLFSSICCALETYYLDGWVLGSTLNASVLKSVQLDHTSCLYVDHTSMVFSFLLWRSEAWGSPWKA